MKPGNITIPLFIYIYIYRKQLNDYSFKQKASPYIFLGNRDQIRRNLRLNKSGVIAPPGLNLFIMIGANNEFFYYFLIIL